MKSKFTFIAILFAIVCMTSCTSDGIKVGILQKVSERPIDGYVIELAFEGGRQVSNGKSSAYENTQEFAIDKAGFDTLAAHVGDRVVVTYHDRGVSVGPSKWIRSLIIK